MGVYFKGYEVAPWDITKSYPIGSVVKYDGREYLAKKDVPVGINIGMSDYWDFGDDERLDNLEEAVEELDGAIQNLELDDLTDVDITEDTLTDGDILQYDEESGNFINKPLTNGGRTYSTTLHKVGTWIDGRNVYEYTYYSENFPASRTIDMPDKITDILEINGTYVARESASTVGYSVPIFKYNGYGVVVNFMTSDANSSYYSTFTIDAGSSVNTSTVHNIAITFTVLLDESEV